MIYVIKILERAIESEKEVFRRLKSDTLKKVSEKNIEDIQKAF
ncbi:hypothetical protein EZS27_027426 [termite gut metagenome]|uniref:Uncharacterized protein n=1 Tax=termite gut metagenome TaxID=433724 RepID=A0A5J4QQ20_9ZZZZ